MKRIVFAEGLFPIVTGGFFLATMLFTEPLPKVASAAMKAFDRMGIKARADERSDRWHTIRSEAAYVQIQVQLEALSARSTRMQVVAREGMFSKDQATATEVILQTENALNGELALR
jgi:hypothetical protein